MINFSHPCSVISKVQVVANGTQKLSTAYSKEMH